MDFGNLISVPVNRRVHALDAALPGPGVLSWGERAFHLHGGYSDRVMQPSSRR